MKVTFALVLFSCYCLSARGDLISAWDNDDLDGSPAGIQHTSKTADVTFAGFTDSVLSRGAGLTTDSGGASSGWPDIFGTRSNNASLSAAITNDAYFTFTITPSGVSDVDYTNFHLELSSALNTEEAALFSSAKSFTAGNQIANYVTSGGVGGVKINSYDTNLSTLAPELQNNTDTLEFRLYVFNVNRLGIGRAFNNADDGIYDLSLSADVTLSAVPEVSAAIAIPIALVITGFGTMLRRRWQPCAVRA